MAAPIAASAQVRVTEGGAAKCVIVTQPGATAPERYAAEELARWLGEVTGVQIETRDNSGEVQPNAIVIGPGPVASALCPDVRLDKLGGEEYVIRTRGGRMLLAGGRPRGTLYAVYRLLQDQLGVRWYAPWCTKVPKQATLTLPAINRRGKPAFESRDPFWFPAFDGDWAARNGSNSSSARLTEKHGGQITYKGFVHTFYQLLPPAQYFKAHPEWFSLVRGQRVDKNAQLCTTNPELRDFIVRQVKEWLRESPGVNIVSVSQNDHAGACECERCKAIDEREGSSAGSLLELVNYVAEKIEPDFSNVAVDTLAYQYTRKAPLQVRPRHNVIVRLCSIECNFAQPLTHPTNAAFARDIRDWHRLTNRLYVWDYTTDFSHYLLPFPNWYVLGCNVRFFHQNGVAGLFEQGAYQSHSNEMSEMHAWVLAQLLWNPYQDDRKLIREFVEAYYGAASAPYILRYFDLVSRRAQPFYVGIGHPDASPFLRFDTLSQAERLWQQAEEAAKSDGEHLWRVRQSHLPVQYMFLSQWVGLRRECNAAHATWPISPSRKDFAEQWIATVNGPGPAGWSPMSIMRESGQAPGQFAASVASDPDPALYEAPARHAASPPTGLQEEELRAAIRVPNDGATIFREPECARPVADPAASDGVAIQMVAGAGGARGATEMYGAQLPKSVTPGRYRFYVVARADVAPGTPSWTVAFRGRVADNLRAGYTADRSVRVEELGSGYRAYLIGTVDIHPWVRLWFGHEHQPGVQTVWFDRILLVPVDGNG
jgi:hypothetical protein